MLRNPDPEVSVDKPVSPTASHQAVQQTCAMVLAGGRGSRLHQLTDWRAKPAVPFGGSLRIIDFALSNCVNSGVRRISVLTQYKAQSLIGHIERGWGFLESSLDEFVNVVPAQQRTGESWYRGTADAVYQNLDLLNEADPKYVLVLAGDHVYKMDYSVMLAEHIANDAQLTISCIDVALERCCDFGILAVDDDGRIAAFAEKPERVPSAPGRPGRALASMGVYVFNADTLYEALQRDAENPASGHDFGYDVLPALIESHRVFAHSYEKSCVNLVGGKAYWRDVGTVDAYWEAHMDLVAVVPQLNLYDDHWPVFSLQQQLAPAKFVFDEASRRGLALDSLVCSGSIVSGATVRHSLIGHKVHIEEGSAIEESVVLNNVRIGRNVRLQRCVIDKSCVLADGFVAGQNPERDRERFHVTPRGITLITPEMLGQRSHARL